MRDPRLLLLHPEDNVLVLRAALPSGTALELDDRRVELEAALAMGHKVARAAIAPGGVVMKYGAPIGYATRPIEPGEHVHTHNVRSGYTPSTVLENGT